MDETTKSLTDNEHTHLIINSLHKKDHQQGHDNNTNHLRNNAAEEKQDTNLNEYAQVDISEVMNVSANSKIPKGHESQNGPMTFDKPNNAQHNEARDEEYSNDPMDDETSEMVYTPETTLDKILEDDTKQTTYDTAIDTIPTNNELQTKHPTIDKQLVIKDEKAEVENRASDPTVQQHSTAENKQVIILDKFTDISVEENTRNSVTDDMCNNPALQNKLPNLNNILDIKEIATDNEECVSHLPNGETSATEGKPEANLIKFYEVNIEEAQCNSVTDKIQKSIEPQDKAQNLEKKTDGKGKDRKDVECDVSDRKVSIEEQKQEANLDKSNEVDNKDTECEKHLKSKLAHLKQELTICDVEGMDNEENVIEVTTNKMKVMSSDRSVEMDVGSSVSDSELVRLDTSIDVHDKEIGNDKYACDFTDKTTLTIDEFIEINKPGGVEVNERGGDECECRLVNDEMKIMKEKQATNLVKSINVDEETASNIIVEKIQKSNLQQSVQENSNKSHVGKDKNVGDMEYRKNISNEIATPKKKVLPNLDNFTDVNVEEVACDNTTVETKNSVFTHLNKSLDIKYRDKDQDHGDFLPHEDNQVTNLSIAEKRKIIQEKLANISNEDNHPHEENQATNLSIAKKNENNSRKICQNIEAKNTSGTNFTQSCE